MLALVGATLYVLEIRDLRCYAAAAIWVPTISGVLLGNVSIPLAFALAVVWRYRESVLAPGRRVWGSPCPRSCCSGPSSSGCSRRAGSARPRSRSRSARGHRRGLGGHRLRRPRASTRTCCERLSELQSERSYSIVGMAATLGVGEGVGRAATLVVGGALLVACVVLARRGDEERSFTCAVAATLALSPIVWLHYLVLLLVPLADPAPALLAPLAAARPALGEPAARLRGGIRDVHARARRGDPRHGAARAAAPRQSARLAAGSRRDRVRAQPRFDRSGWRRRSSTACSLVGGARLIDDAAPAFASGARASSAGTSAAVYYPGWRGARARQRLALHRISTTASTWAIGTGTSTRLSSPSPSLPSHCVARRPCSVLAFLALSSLHSRARSLLSASATFGATQLSSCGRRVRSRSRWPTSPHGLRSSSRLRGAIGSGYGRWRSLSGDVSLKLFLWPLARMGVATRAPPCAGLQLRSAFGVLWSRGLPSDSRG